MKPLITLLLLTTVFSVNAYAQSARTFHINFDTASYMQYGVVKIDTVDTNNQWQIGPPQKTVFTAAYSGMKAIVTDTTQVCVPSDTSVFEIDILSVFHTQDSTFYLKDFSYWQSLDLDSGDLAIVEDSTWKWDDVRKDTVSTSGWSKVSHYPQHGLGPVSFYTLRFIFITDTSTKLRDGWMLDSFSFNYVLFMGIDQHEQNSFKLYPNPASDDLHIVQKLSQPLDLKITFYNTIGQIVREEIFRQSSKDTKLSVRDLPDGVYYCTISSGTDKSVQRIVIIH